MKGNVTISRNNHDEVTIRFRCEASRVEFATLTLSLEAYAEAITGLSEVQGELQVVSLEHVGKNRITERRSIKCPLKWVEKNSYASWLKENAQEEGWTLNTHLGSQNSIQHRDDHTILNYSVTKYVDAT